MSKKIKINEQQLALLVNYIKESQNSLTLTEDNILEEGFKEWAIAGLMTLASLSGIKAQDSKGINPETIKAAELVQNKLEQGDTTLLKYFDEVGIEKNRKNLEKLKNADLKRGKFKTITAKPEDVSKKLKHGYVVSDFKITKDTLVSEIQKNSEIITNFSTSFDSDLFLTGKYNLDESVKMELNKIVKIVKIRNGEIFNIKIESSTDTEPIKMGNEKLAQLRAESITKYLSELGVDTSNVSITIKPEQGPDIYSVNMTDAERNDARVQTKDYRYVKIEYDISIPIDKLPMNEKVYNVIEDISIEMVRPIHKTKGDKIKTKYKPEKCKIKKPKIKSGQPVIYKCP